MESLQQIKQRRRSVQNISQITKAMELVAATKMRRTQEMALMSRPYAAAALELLARLSNEDLSYVPPLLAQREIKKKAVVVVTSDKGLAGAFNGNVLKNFDEYLRENTSNPKEIAFIAVGQRSHDYLAKIGFPPKQSFTRHGDYVSVEQLKPLSDFLVEGYINGDWDEVTVFSSHFINALKQKVVSQKIFPVKMESLMATVKEIIPQSGKYAETVPETPKPPRQAQGMPKTEDYLIEPTPEVTLEELVPHLVGMQIYHLMLEANASEHSARRLAMKNASDNAVNLSGELTLLYNKSRQASITREIIEITAGAESMKK